MKVHVRNFNSIIVKVDHALNHQIESPAKLSSYKIIIAYKVCIMYIIIYMYLDRHDSIGFDVHDFEYLCISTTPNSLFKLKILNSKLVRL